MAGQACNDNRATINTTKSSTTSAADCVKCRNSQSAGEPIPSAERRRCQRALFAVTGGFEVADIGFPLSEPLP
jgi:hypothetical protein